VPGTLRLVVVHYHLRPGGIRRVIENALPSLVRHAPAPVDHVILATGEAEDVGWNKTLRTRLRPVPVVFHLDPALGYMAEQREEEEPLHSRVRHGLARLLDAGAPDETVVWAHNLGIARNLVLTQELLEACAARGIRVLAHHHDWWFENRWQRWKDVRQAGVRSLATVARVTFPFGAGIRHAAINSLDAGILRRHMGQAAGWLPNLSGRLRSPEEGSLQSARRWMDRQLHDRGAPIWILPCRLLRRKNVAEALLLARWLRPEAWTVVTGSASSAEEQVYSNRLSEAARAGRWRLRIGLLQVQARRAPGIPELLGASEVVLLTSMQEGFGLPYLEAAAAGRPLLARSLPNIGPDLQRFGFRFPHLYEEVRIDPCCFDWTAEVKRQEKLYRQWLRELPVDCRSLAGKPWLLLRAHQPQPMPFSRLTLSAQLEVVAQAPEQSWAASVRWKPLLARWRSMASSGELRCTTWPRSADRWLGEVPYARRFWRLLRTRRRQEVQGKGSARLQAEFLQVKLASEQLYPLLWTLDS
jgi:glycosyltransferase involved in cell wall biosynthesis